MKRYSILAIFILCLQGVVFSQFTIPQFPGASKAPNEIIITSETLNGSVRVFNAKSGKLKSWFNLSVPSGAGRALAVNPESGDLWVKDGVSTLKVFNKNNQQVNSLTINLPCCGNCGSGEGITGFDFGPGPNGQLYAVGGWKSGSMTHLLQVDTVTQQTIGCIDLNVVIGGFQPYGLAVGPGPNGVGTFVYIVEAAAPGRIARFDLGLSYQGTVATFPLADIALGSIDVQDSGALLVAAYGSGQLFLSTAGQTAWSQLDQCGTYISYSSASTTRSHLGYFVAGPLGCVGNGHSFRVFAPFSGISYYLDSSAGGMFQGAPSSVAIRE